jgi:cobalt-zinc-cadmium efflux system protein
MADAVNRRLLIALEINAAFLVVEAVGGWLTNSLALLSDAAHMLTDVAALGLALGARWLASRPATTRRSYGYRRAEILAAFLNALLLWAIVAGVLWEALHRLRAPQAVDAGVMSGIALLGLAANAVSAYMLAGEHGDINVRGAFLHLAADTLGSLGALGAGVYMLLGGSPAVDPLASILIAGLVFWGSLGLMRQSVDILMESTPAHLDVAAITRSLAALRVVREVHDLHVWQIGSGLVSLTGHLIVDAEADRDRLLLDARGVLHAHHGIEHLTIQLETPELHRFLTTAEQTVRLERKRPPSPDA